MSESNKKLVVFDFDGVLVNSLELWFQVNQKANPHLTYDQYSEMSHGNYFESFEGENAKFTFNHSLESIDIYRTEVMNLHTSDAIREMLPRLADKYKLTIVSSGSEVTIQKFLQKENMATYFSEILGNETHKSKALKLDSLLKKYGLISNDCLFVTDTLGDVLEAHQVGIKSIGVLWGLHTRETLEKGKPEAIIERPEELEETIEKILNS